jgi:putative ABC transport system substrate-binding protein
MERRAFITLLAGGMLAAPLAAEGQQAGKVLRVGLLGNNPLVPALYEMFKEGLGYTEGQQVVFIDQHADSVPSRLPSAASALVQARPDVILARGPAAVAAVTRATTTIPIVAVDLESDPIALGYAKTLARPGGNVTGVFLNMPDLSAKQLQLFREIVPGLSHVALIGDSTGNAAQLRATQRAAQAFGVQVQTFEGRTALELDAALEAARRNGAGGVIIFSSPAVFYNLARIAALAQEKRLPTVSLFTEFARGGGLMTYGPSLGESFRRCGIYVGKVLRGAKPAGLPIERPQTFELVVNLKTAKALGLTIPPSLLLRADEVIH